jgi:hypothetical protein
VKVIRERLTWPGISELIESPALKHAAAISVEIRALRDRLARTEQDYDEGRINGGQYREMKRQSEAELESARARRALPVPGADLAWMLSAPDPVTAFVDASLSAKRAVVAFLCTIELLRVPQGRKGFDPGTIRITWRDHSAHLAANCDGVPQAALPAGSGREVAP